MDKSPSFSHDIPPKQLHVNLASPRQVVFITPEVIDLWEALVAWITGGMRILCTSEPIFWGKVVP